MNTKMAIIYALLSIPATLIISIPPGANLTGEPQGETVGIARGETSRSADQQVYTELLAFISPFEGKSLGAHEAPNARVEFGELQKAPEGFVIELSLYNGAGDPDRLLWKFVEQNGAILRTLEGPNGVGQLQHRLSKAENGVWYFEPANQAAKAIGVRETLDAKGRWFADGTASGFLYTATAPEAALEVTTVDRIAELFSEYFVPMYYSGQTGLKLVVDSSLKAPEHYEVSVAVSFGGSTFDATPTTEVFTLTQSGDVVRVEAAGDFYLQSAQEMRLVNGMLRMFEQPYGSTSTVHYLDLETGMFFQTIQSNVFHTMTTYWPTGMDPDAE